MSLKNLSIKLKLQLLVFCCAALILTIGLFNLFVQKEQQLNEREEKLQHQVETALSLVKHFQNHQDISESEAKALALSALGDLRYEGSNYFWITDSNNNLVLHPLRPNNVGNDMSQVQDGAGKYHWQEMSQIARTKQSGFLDYTWKSPEGELLDKISYVSYIENWDWIVGSGLFVSDIESAFLTNILKQSLTTLIAVSLLFVASFFISNSVIRPIDVLLKNLKTIAEGDLTRNIKQHRGDEIGQLSVELDQMQSTIRDTLLTAKTTANKAGLLSSNIASSSEETAHSIASQNKQLEHLSVAMNEMSATINDVATNAETSAEMTGHATQQAQIGSKSMQSTVCDVSSISASINETTALMHALKQGVDSIGEVVQVIQEVSEQTNLLALNAAIEAARAGEKGRGFAVVADEVRNLASRTQASTNQVQQTINELNSNTSDAVSVINANNRSITDTVDGIQKTEAIFKNMVEELNKASSMVVQIAAAAEQQGVVSNDMSENVSTIHLSASQISESSELLASQTQEMVTAAKDLKKQLTFFKLS